MFVRILLQKAILLTVGLFGCGIALGSTLCVDVKDYADLPLHDARVTIVNLRTNVISSATTDIHGKTCVTELMEGMYSVEVGLRGFLNVRYYPIRLTVPGNKDLDFRLPFGEIMEGGVGSDAIVSGTLRNRDALVPDASVCLLQKGIPAPIACTSTNELGEYALSVRPGLYVVEVKLRNGEVHRAEIKLPSPGVYRDRVY